ncbi:MULTISPECIES: hypothetical protein [unclassified Roseateles]|uniref:hypothetical protein n=1 Tax=unclassified Roseateles TaxID=2626991 RepID=UPI0006F8C8D4|nr:MULTISPECIES: hypothetical protein [unclassified Roseateles]KQW43336.1 hypothetical protein ASC81_16225 [Pelomonas sp. Root405]KRA71074.1 hypothetical protein ASD88_14745 [Pelomonas sp. Root662]
MLRSFLAALAAGAALLGATAAQAGTQWSIGINVPAAGVVVSNGSRYYVEPAPVYYAPPPVVYHAPRHRHVHREVYYVPAPRVVYHAPHRGDRRWDRHDGHRHWDRGHGRHDHHHHRWDGDHGPHRGR